MNPLILVFALLLASLPAAARAQVEVRINIGLPAAPPMVVVQPGIKVVENYQEEVFFTDGYYWVRREPYWYRARQPSATFALVESRHVPPGLRRLPPGQYKHWHKAEMKDARSEEKAERKRGKKRAKAERQGNDPGKGHGHGRDD